MAEQTFRSPGFFEQEIDLSQRRSSPLGIPAGVIGTADRGPAFVPVTVGTFADFETRFGTLNSERAAFAKSQRINREILSNISNI